MSDNKAVQKIPKYWFYIGGLFLLWIIWYLKDTSYITPGTFLSKVSVEALKWSVMFGLFTIVSVIVLWLRSPVITYPGGHTSWDPGRPFITINPPPDLETGEPIMSVKFIMFPLGGFKAGKIYKKGGGPAGWGIAAEYLFRENWPNLDIQASTVHFYNTAKAKRDIPTWIYKQAKEKGNQTLGFDEEATLMFFIMPNEEVKLDPKLVAALHNIDFASFANAEARLYEDKYEDVQEQLLTSQGTHSPIQPKPRPNFHNSGNDGGGDN